MKLFALRDTKAEAFNRPFCSATRATACREIAVGIAKDPIMQEYSLDFSIYELGHFDTDTGILHGLIKPHHVVDVSELLNEDLTPVRVSDSVEDSHAQIPTRLMQGN